MKVEILKQKGHRFLWINDYLWMWDIPIEQDTQRKIANEAYGNVLVAGYGLGIVQKHLLLNPKVDSVTTIEITPEVIEACKKEYKCIYGKVINGDFYEYISPYKFNCVIGDIWEDILPEGLEEYERFKNKATRLLNDDGKILAWGKDFFEYLITKRR